MTKMKCLWNYIKSRLPLLLLAVCIITCAVASAVYAKYVKSLDNDITLDITGSGGVNITVTKTGDEYTITNNSNIPVYVRFTVTINWADNNGNLYYIPPSNQNVSAPNCTLHTDGYYYYNGQVDPNDFFDDIVASATGPAPSGYETLYVQVLAEAIQCEPADAVETAWGVKFNGTTWVTP